MPSCISFFLTIDQYVSLDHQQLEKTIRNQLNNLSLLEFKSVTPNLLFAETKDKPEIRSCEFAEGEGEPKFAKLAALENLLVFLKPEAGLFLVVFSSMVKLEIDNSAVFPLNS